MAASTFSCVSRFSPEREYTITDTLPAMPLYNRLKEYRARLGVNQQEMGRLAGVSRQTISQIERGDYSPSVTLALKLAKLCQVSVEDIFSYEEDKHEAEK